MRIPFLKPDIRESDIKRMNESIRSGWLVHGEYTKEFENEMEKFIGSRPFMTSSCTASLHMALILAGVKEGDEVITTPISWVSTANVILYQGAKVVFADVDPLTGILDIEDVKQKITPRTKAVIVVHLYGQMADMREFSKLPVPVIEDAAHALEAERDGIRPGKLGTACFSFHAAKNITCGQGGAIIAKDINACKLLVRDGVVNINNKRIMLTFGYKYDSTDFQAALLVGQMKRIKETHAKRLEVYKRYEEAFKGMCPQRTGTHAAHMFVIWVDPKKRDLIRKELLEKGIETSIHYEPIHREPFYGRIDSLPVAEKMGASVITLPTYALTEKEQNYVITEVKRCL